MSFTPWRLLVVALAGWMNRQKQEVIEYLREENRVLREKLGHKRIILNDNQRRRLATAAVKLGRDLLRQFRRLFSPDTLLKWHRYLVACKYDDSTFADGGLLRLLPLILQPVSVNATTGRRPVYVQQLLLGVVTRAGDE